MKITQNQFNKWFKIRGVQVTDRNILWDSWNLAINEIFQEGVQRQPEFFIQCAYESNYFQTVSENLRYSTPERILQVFGKRVGSLHKAKQLAGKPELLAEAVYGRRMGNDSAGAKRLYEKGWKVFDFRGQGYIQLTGFDNWRSFKEQTGINCFTDREYFMKNPWHGAGFYWVLHKLDYVPGVKEHTRVINGAHTGLKVREKLFAELLTIMRDY